MSGLPTPQPGEANAVSGEQSAAAGTAQRGVLSEAIAAAIMLRGPELLALSHDIHANPELGHQEHRASAAVAALASSVPGVSVHRGVGQLETALRAEAGTGELVITVCAEYDALPGVGHACGHNVIATAATGAFLALAPLADELGATIRLLGTPAEETTGGKINLLDAGEFDGTHVAMMIHPGDEDVVGMRPYACSGYRVEFHGQSAHASAMPHLGVNALDAMTLALTAIGLNRQQLAPLQQMHGAVLSGGDAPNVIPDLAVGEFMVRADTAESLAAVDAVLMRCLEAGALATGTRLVIEPIGESFLSILPDTDLEAVFGSHSEQIGRPLAPAGLPAGSTDMGNVSQRFPTIHPMIGLGPDCPPIHSPEFAAFAGGTAGDKAALDGALCLALTALDCAVVPERRARLLEGLRS